MSSSDVIKRKPGRKPIHASPAARAAAYRARKAEKIAAALAQGAESMTTALAALQSQLTFAHEQLRFTQEALTVERDLVRQFNRPTRKSSKVNTSTAPNERTVSAARLAILRHHFVDGPYPRADDAKRLRVNAKKAAGAATEILWILKGVSDKSWQAVDGDIEALVSTINLLTTYGDLIEAVQRGAKTKTVQQVQEKTQLHEQNVRSVIAALFPNPEMMIRDATKTATELLAYETEGVAWLCANKQTDGASLHVEKGHELRRALQKGDVARLVHLIAEEKIAMPGQGRHFTGDDGKTYWIGGWGDFDAWRNSRAPTVTGTYPLP